jgi:hypothetical protein
LVFQGFCKFFQGFFGFGHFQQSASFSTLAVRCLHEFKLAGTNRLTTAAMNIRVWGSRLCVPILKCSAMT